MGFFRLETSIAAPRPNCFELALSVDAHSESMAGSRERATAGVTHGVMKPGDSVTWNARHFGIPFAMTSAITEYDAPSRFVDEQQRGPFARWWHEHTFVVVSESETLMVDVVDFKSPAGPVGAMVDLAVLNRYMANLISQRNGWLKSALEGQA
jgi:ligand-binding SRPBCC domain-containing protein